MSTLSRDKESCRWCLGLSSRNGFRVFELSDPKRLVVDVKH